MSKYLEHRVVSLVEGSTCIIIYTPEGSPIGGFTILYMLCDVAKKSTRLAATNQ